MTSIRIILMTALGLCVMQSAFGAEVRELSDAELKMKERVTALSQGEGDMTRFRIELFYGDMVRSVSAQIIHGAVLSQTYDRPGGPSKTDKRDVTDDEIRGLLKELVAKQYWIFQGTKFVPDAEALIFRLRDKDLPPVDYRCDAEEIGKSPEREAIRTLFVTFLSGAPPPAPQP